MTIRLTGLEYKRFFADNSVWPEGSWVEYDSITVNGEELAEGLNEEEIDDKAVVIVDGGCWYPDARMTTAFRDYERMVAEWLKQQHGPAPHIFLDCDGVLADFDRYARAYFGMCPREYEEKVGSDAFWLELEEHGSFYRDMPVMADAQRLVDGVRHLNPTILTGCPKGDWAQAQKVAWAEDHFPGIPIITCRSKLKATYGKPGDVLIDDWPQHRHHWIEMGGIWISHYDAKSSLAALWAHYPELKG